MYLKMVEDKVLYALRNCRERNRTEKALVHATILKNTHKIVKHYIRDEYD